MKRRLAIGAAIAAAGTAVSLLTFSDVSLGIVVAVAVVTAGAVIRSGWSLVIVPLTVIGTVSLWAEIACTDCFEGHDDTQLTGIVLFSIYYAWMIMAGAAAGSIAGWLIHRALREPRH